MKHSKIYFNEQLHKYTDEFGNTLTSVTTAIGKYEEKFDTDNMARVCARIGKNPSHPKYNKYKGKSEKQLKKEWEATTLKALDNGNEKHNYLEDVIKSSNNYKRVKGNFINDRIFTIPDIIEHESVGQVTIDKLIELGLNSRYPIIFNTIVAFVNDGWKLYSEIGVYNIELLISGLVDLLLVKGDEFIILDWKTNKAPITFDSGYFEKNDNGELTDNFIKTDKYLLYPLNYIVASVGNKYSMQLSGYAYLIEHFGLKCKGIILCHIRTVNDEDVVKLLNIKYMKDEAKALFEHHNDNRVLENQTKLFT